METEGKTLATVRLRLAAIAAAHRLGGHPDPTSRPLVQATQSRILTDHGLRDDRIFTDVASGQNMRRPAGRPPGTRGCHDDPSRGPRPVRRRRQTHGSGCGQRHVAQHLRSYPTFPIWLKNPKVIRSFFLIRCLFLHRWPSR